MTIFERNFWRTRQDLLLVLVITLFLIGIYVLMVTIYNIVGYASWNGPDIDDKLRTEISFALVGMGDWSITLSLITTPLAVYFVTRNDRLTFPIRLLAAAENVNKFVYAIVHSLSTVCKLMLVIRCSSPLRNSLYAVVGYLDDYDPLSMSQYCQLFISISRFFALAFDGIYFRHTLRWPFAQLIIPYAFGIAFKHVRWWIVDEYWYDPNYDILITPCSLMCALDFVTNRNLKKHKRGGKVSRAESLLMWQMLINSFVNIINLIGYYIFSILVNLFFGWNVMIVYLNIIQFNQTFLMCFVPSIFSCIFLRKPKETQRRGTTVSVISAHTKTVATVK